MIYVSVYGRMGNQMFQYAFARALQEKRAEMGCNDELAFCFAGVLGSAAAAQEAYADTYKNQLVHFQTEKYLEITDPQHPYGDRDEVRRTFLQKIVMRLWGRYYGKKLINNAEEQEFERKWQRFLNFFGIINYSAGYYPFAVGKSQKTLLCRGTFECEKYFEGIKDKLKKEFIVRDEICEWNREIYAKIEHTQAVCLAVRCGDFMEDAGTRRLYYVCTPEYFEQAIKRITEKVEQPLFFVFSDNIAWVKENIRLPMGAVYEDARNPVWETFRLMCRCKHFIISNSTFHWWAQYLGAYENKVVCAPDKWRVSGRKLDIIQDSWETIEV